MLNMGFREDIETILSGVPEERQTVLFSATMPKPILEITKRFQKDAEVIKVTKKELTVPNIEQFYYDVKPKTKRKCSPAFWTSTLQDSLSCSATPKNR